MQKAGTNIDQIEFWNGRSARRWVQFQERQDRMLHPLGRRALEVTVRVPGDEEMVIRLLACLPAPGRTRV